MTDRDGNHPLDPFMRDRVITHLEEILAGLRAGTLIASSFDYSTEKFVSGDLDVTYTLRYHVRKYPLSRGTRTNE